MYAAVQPNPLSFIHLIHTFPTNTAELMQPLLPRISTKDRAEFPRVSLLIGYKKPLPTSNAAKNVRKNSMQ